jgi:hypothetical protein
MSPKTHQFLNTILASAKTGTQLARPGKPYVWLIRALVGNLALLGAFSVTHADQPSISVSSVGEALFGTGINNLPYAITRSGSYRLTRNFDSYARTNGAAILIQLRDGNNDVVLDLNGHTITYTNQYHVGHSSTNGINTQRSPTGIQVISTGSGRVTLRDGVLRGFGTGIDIAGGSGAANGAVVENMTVVHAGAVGILVSGTNGVVRNCQVRNTGDVPNVIASGIACLGPGMRIINNDVQGVKTLGGAFGILVGGDDAMLENNRVSNVHDLGQEGVGITIAGASVLVVNSRVADADSGIVFVGGCTGYYRDNLVTGAIVPYNNSGAITDAGNNQ